MALSNIFWRTWDGTVGRGVVVMMLLEVFIFVCCNKSN
jgi:hypothetical protein